MRYQLSWMTVSVAVLLSLSAAAVADTIYVNGATGNDAWDGRREVWDGGYNSHVEGDEDVQFGHLADKRLDGRAVSR